MRGREEALQSSVHVPIQIIHNEEKRCILQAWIYWFTKL